MLEAVSFEANTTSPVSPIYSTAKLAAQVANNATLIHIHIYVRSRTVPGFVAKQWPSTRKGIVCLRCAVYKLTGISHPELLIPQCTHRLHLLFAAPLLRYTREMQKPNHPAGTILLLTLR